MTILAARRVLPPDLIVPADASAPRMKLTGPDAVPPPLRCSFELRMFDRLMPEPEPPLKMMPSSRYQLRIASMVSSTARMKHALALLWDALHADVEPHRRVERGALVHEHVLELVAECLRFSVVDEVPVADAPVGDRVDDAVDHLAQRPLPFGQPERAAEVLLGDDVRRVERPIGRELDVGLEEGIAPVLEVRDARIAALPLHGVVRIDRRVGEVPSDPDSRCWPPSP